MIDKKCDKKFDNKKIYMRNRNQPQRISKHSESPDKIKINNKHNQELSKKNSSVNLNTNELSNHKYNQKPKTTENVQRIC